MSIVSDEVHVVTLALLVKVNGQRSQKHSSRGKETSKDLGRNSPWHNRCRLDALHEIASHVVGVDAVWQPLKALLALAGHFVHSLTNIGDLVRILVVPVVLVVLFLGLHTGDAGSVDETLFAVRKFLTIVESLKCAGCGWVRASLFFEDAEEDLLSVGAAVGSDVILAFLVVVTLVCLAVLKIVVAHNVFIDIELGTFHSILHVEVEVLRLAVVVVALHLVTVLHVSVGVARRQAVILIVGLFAPAVLLDALAVVLLSGKLGLHHSIDELGEVDDIVSSISTRAAAVGRAELKVDKALLVHSIVPFTVLSLVVIVTLVVVLQGTVSIRLGLLVVSRLLALSVVVLSVRVLPIGLSIVLSVGIIVIVIVHLLLPILPLSVGLQKRQLQKEEKTHDTISH